MSLIQVEPESKRSSDTELCQTKRGSYYFVEDLGLQPNLPRTRLLPPMSEE